KTSFKFMGKGLKKAVGSIPLIGKPIVGIAGGLKDMAKGVYKGVKAGIQTDPRTKLLQAQALQKLQQTSAQAAAAALTPALPEALAPQLPEETAAPAPVGRASVEIAPGTAPAVPEVKAEGKKNLLLAAGGAAALGAGAYAYVKSQD
ncbi:MAG: hypothetical protein AB1405_16390, partial [Bdellovibrionota bacterium]